METFINDIKHRDAKLLCGYLETLSYQESVEFVDEVVRAAGVHRRTFFNWKYMCCRIPLWAKEIMENIAGRTIFSPQSIFKPTTTMTELQPKCNPEGFIASRGRVRSWGCHSRPFAVIARWV